MDFLKPDTRQRPVAPESAGLPWDDAEAFEARAAVLGAQHSQYEPLPGAKVNGEWYEAFDVQPNEKLFVEPKDRVRIW